MLKLRKLMAAALSVVGLQACIFGGVQPLTGGNTVTAASYSEMIPFIEGEHCYYKMIDENDDGIYDYAEICETHTINNTEIIVPSEVDGLPVLSIGKHAFYDPFSYLEKLKSVKIESGVVSIGENAFYDSYHLENVDLPDTITYIGDNAFKNCNNLKSIRIPSGLTTINAGTFSTCIRLSSVTIPKNVNNIGSEAFANCGNLKSITIENPDCKIYDSQDTIYSNFRLGSNNNEKIFEGTIYGYEGSTAQAYAEKYNCKFKAIDGQPPVTTSPAETTTVKTETTVTTATTVKTDLPVTTAPMVSDVMYPASMTKPVSTTIKNSVCYEYSYTEIGKKQGVKIDACAGKVKELEIPSEINGKPVIALGPSAFSVCPGVESIIIPENVEKIIIGSGSFICPNLKSITVSENNEKYSSEDGILFNKDKSVLVKFPTASPLTTFKIPESVSEIYFDAFGDCANLTDVIIPENVDFIKDCAFESCKNLKSITIMNPACRIADPSATICNGSSDGSRKSYNGVIYGYGGSSANEYAKIWGYKFENIGEYTMRVADVVRLKKMIVSGYMAYSEIYDLNNDGAVNVFDMIALRRSLLNP